MAAEIKIRIGQAVLSGSPSPSQTPPLRGVHLRPQISRHSLLASHNNGRGRPTTVGFLIHGSAIKRRDNPMLFNHLRNSNRRLKGGMQMARQVNDGVDSLWLYFPTAECNLKTHIHVFCGFLRNCFRGDLFFGCRECIASLRDCHRSGVITA